MNSTATICALNDALRTLTGEGRICFTAGISALPRDEQAKIMERVFDFDEFTPESDPHDEHDFGSFDHDGKTIFWKIDYYDRDLKFGSPDPSDPAVTTRVLTVLLAEEY